MAIQQNIDRYYVVLLSSGISGYLKTNDLSLLSVFAMEVEFAICNQS